MRVLKSSGEVREHYNRRYRYILIDEYQDTNRPQYELMSCWPARTKMSASVGDEDQSIYSWRGADIRNILEFEQDFPSAKSFAWNRTTALRRKSLKRASAVVAKNVQRKGKNLWTRARRHADRLLRSAGR